MRRGSVVYRVLLRLYPAGFREHYGALLEQQFADERAALLTRADRVRFWGRVLTDFVLSWASQVILEVRQDARVAWRAWRREPLSTGLAFASLALAFGISLGLFSVLNGLLLRPLPFKDSARLVTLGNVSVPLEGAALQDWARNRPVLEGVARFTTMEASVAAEGAAAATTRQQVTQTSAGFFDLLGVTPRAGRAFAPDEDRDGRSLVAVISDDFWRGGFGGDPSAVGSSVRVNGTLLTVIGVAPPGFDYPARTAVWTPTVSVRAIPTTESVSFLTTVGRLRAGVSIADARRLLLPAAGPTVAQEHADGPPILTPVRDDLAGRGKRMILVLTTGALLLVALSCAAVATLLVARTAARSGEWATRLALGASRARLVQQLVIECALIVGAAALAGMAVALWVARLMAAVMPPSLQSQTYAATDWRVAAGVAVLCVAMVAICCGAPVALITRARSTSGERATKTARVRRIQRGLVAAQIALALLVASGALGLARAFVALARTDPGFDPHGVMTLRLSVVGTAEQSRPTAYYRAVVERAEAVPGVVSASGTTMLPFGPEAGMHLRFGADGVEEPIAAGLVYAGPRYFQTLGASLRAGRDFEASDLTGADPVAVVNEHFAKLLGSSEAALGRYLLRDGDRPRRIVGVVQPIHYTASLEAYPVPQVFVPRLSSSTISLLVKADRPVDLPLLRNVIRGVNPGVPMFDIRPLTDRVEGSFARPRLYTAVGTVLAGLAWLLMVTAVYGVVSFEAGQRTHEMGIRMAVGGTPMRLRLLLLSGTGWLVALGVVPGALGAILAGRALSVLVEDATVGMGVLSGAVALVVMTAGLATWLATRSLARLEVARILCGAPAAAAQAGRGWK